MNYQDWKTIHWVDHYTKELEEGNIDLHEIRSDMEQKGASEQRQDTTMKILLSQDLQNLAKKTSSSDGMTSMKVGLFLILFGAVFTFLSYTQTISLGRSTYVVLYGPVLAGLFYLIKGGLKMNS